MPHDRHNDEEKLARLRDALAVGEEQAIRGEFAEDYNLDELNNELDSEITKQTNTYDSSYH